MHWGEFVVCFGGEEEELEVRKQTASNMEQSAKLTLAVVWDAPAEHKEKEGST